MGRVAQKKSHLCNVKARRAAGGRSRAEEWRDAVRAPVTLRFELLSTQGHCDARSNVVAERHGVQEVCPADAEPLTSRKGGGHHSAPWMRLRRGVRIVRFVGMSQHPIRECRFDRAAYNFRGHDRGEFSATIDASKLHRHTPGC